jgi:hypothetical protein
MAQSLLNRRYEFSELRFVYRHVSLLRTPDPILITLDPQYFAQSVAVNIQFSAIELVTAQALSSKILGIELHHFAEHAPSGLAPD